MADLGGLERDLKGLPRPRILGQIRHLEPGLGCGVLGSEFGIQGSGFGVRGLGFGVWGLGFSV